MKFIALAPLSPLHRLMVTVLSITFQFETYIGISKYVVKYQNSPRLY